MKNLIRVLIIVLMTSGCMTAYDTSRYILSGSKIPEDIPDSTIPIACDIALGYSMAYDKDRESQNNFANGVGGALCIVALDFLVDFVLYGCFSRMDLRLDFGALLGLGENRLHHPDFLFEEKDDRKLITRFLGRALNRKEEKYYNVSVHFNKNKVTIGFLHKKIYETKTLAVLSKKTLKETAKKDWRVTDGFPNYLTPTWIIEGIDEEGSLWDIEYNMVIFIGTEEETENEDDLQKDDQ